jgi:hypothetical protein
MHLRNLPCSDIQPSQSDNSEEPNNNALFLTIAAIVLLIGFGFVVFHVLWKLSEIH